MSCDACEKFQKAERTSYYRWKNANIEVRACEQHLTEVFARLRDPVSLSAEEIKVVQAMIANCETLIPGVEELAKKLRSAT